MSDFEQTTLANLSIVRQLTNQLGSGTKKSLGQNFLVNQNTLLKFLNTVHIANDDIVVEIGPGIGVISYTLCQKAQKAYLIEIDRSKEKALHKTLENFNNYEIIWEDAAQLNWADLAKKIKDEQGRDDFKVIGSLPYNSAKKIIYNFLTSGVKWSEAAFFLQREVAENYTSVPPHADFLSIFTQLYASVNFAFSIPPEHFYPQPKVKTGVIHLVRSDKYSEIDRVKFGKFIKHGFKQPRKTLLNNFKDLGFLANDLSSQRIKETARPSELTVDQWELLFKIAERKVL